VKFASVADWLDAAADYLENHGWWRGALLGPNRNQSCAVGAILFSADLDESQVQDPEVARACQALMKAIDGSENIVLASGNVMTWNDDKERGARGKQHVLDTFRKAAKIERAGFDPDEGITT